MKRYIYRLRNINTGKVYIGEYKGHLFDPEDIISDMFNYGIKNFEAYDDYTEYGEDSIAIDLLLTASSRLVTKDSILTIVELFKEEYTDRLYQDDMDIDSNFKSAPSPINYDYIDDMDKPDLLFINELMQEGHSYPNVNKKLPKITDFM